MRAGLFADNNEATYAFMEAIDSLKTPRQLCYLFVDLLTNNCILIPLQFWETFCVQMARNFTFAANNNEETGQTEALQALGNSLEGHGKTLEDYGLPQPETKK